MSLTPGAEAFATILTMLVHPDTPDTDLEDAVFQLREETARHALIALAAMFSGYILDDAARERVSTEEMMSMVRDEIRERTEASEYLNQKGGA